MARRIVVLFVLCALLPVICLAVIASSQVTGELRTASRQRLHQAAKDLGMESLDQLRRVDSDLTLIEVTILNGGPASQPSIPARLHSRLAEQFTGLAVVSPKGTVRVLIGSNPTLAQPTPPAIAHMRAGKTALTVTAGSGGRPRLVMTRFLESWGEGHLLWAHINEAFIWSRDSAPPRTEVLVIGPSPDPLFASLATPRAALGTDAIQKMRAASSGETEWTHEGETYSARYWSLPLNFDFLASDWTIVVSEAKADVLAPIRSSRITFVLVTTLSLWVVTLLSLSQVRRSMVPLAQLREGTQRLGRGDFDGRVDVRSGDEFEDLAGSFNTMAGRLKRQFDTLSAMAELDRAVLSSLDVETIARGALDRLPRLVGCDDLAVIVLDPQSTGRARGFVKGTLDGASARETSVAITPKDAQALLGHQIHRISREHGVPGYLSSLVTTGWATCVLFPLVFAGRLVGIVALGNERPFERSPEDLEHARQLAAQIGMALSNADLVQALDRLNVGTLSALARTVDAKSPWTAGHSERVTDMAVEIGRALGLSAKELDGLARGGLLHDIGKIAVPTEVLNKPGPLTPEEFAVMREHPRTGARILEPIPEYSHLIPIVLQHHEWFDGRGYPFGLAGEAIASGARIVAVADVFDALTSKRPYRKPMSLDEAVTLIRDGTGTQFDPRMVDAFLTVIDGRAHARDDRRPAPRSLEPITSAKAL